MSDKLTRQSFSPFGMVHEQYEAINRSQHQPMNNPQVPLQWMCMIITVNE